MTVIHATAIVEAGAELDPSVEIGPYAVLGPHVRLGAGTIVGAHAVISGHTHIGKNNRIYSHAAVGTPPQDKKYKGEASLLEIGDDNHIREFTTLNPGTDADRGKTSIGNGNLLMAYVHVAHDCEIGDRNVFSNASQLAGHVIVADDVTLGGMSGVHQFVRLGTGSMVGGGSMVTLDVPPYCIAAGNRASLHGLNLVGLKRRDPEGDATAALKEAYRILFRQGLRLQEALAEVQKSVASTPEVAALLAFIGASSRGICRPDG